MGDWYEERFEPKFIPEPNSGCWLWTALRDRDGYGLFRIRAHDREQRAHRVSFAHHRGAIRDGMQLDHRCRTRCCVNPWHLEPVTPRENSLRSAVSLAAVNAAKTHCKRGHEFTPENTRRFGPEGRNRSCRICQRMHVKEWHRRMYEDSGWREVRKQQRRLRMERDT